MKFMKTESLLGKRNRNDPCWCGSGKKYKKCHLSSDAALASSTNKFEKTNPKKIVRSTEYINGMRAASRLAKEALDMIEERIQPGISTNRLDRWVHDFLIDHDAIPAPLNYNGFPKSICTSVNEVVCHGIPDDRFIQDGDLINIDITAIKNGYHGDTSKTFLIGECSAEAKKITEVSRQCLDRAIAVTAPYKHIGDIGAVITEYATSQGCSVVEKFVGHGIGKMFHEEPQVPHFGKQGHGELILPGMFFTIEPMINLGKKDVKILNDGWTAVTVDAKLSAQFEHTIYITDTGIEVLTA